MTNTELLAILNDTRKALGMTPLKSWKASGAALREALDKLNAQLAEQTKEKTKKSSKPATDVTTSPELAARMEISPKTLRAKLRRHLKNIPEKCFAGDSRTTFVNKHLQEVINLLEKDHRKTK